MPISIHKELRHRGEPLVEYPGADLWKTVGGSDGVMALIEDLYRRIEQNELLRVAFPHFNSEEAAHFFMQWFGGSRGYSDELAGGLLQRHQHRYISPKAAAAWTRTATESSRITKGSTLPHRGQSSGTATGNGRPSRI